MSPSYFIKSPCDSQPPVKQRLTTHWFDATSVTHAGLLNSYSRKAALAQPGDAEVLPKLENRLTGQDAGKEADRGADEEKRNVPEENIGSRRPQVLFLKRTAERTVGN